MFLKNINDIISNEAIAYKGHHSAFAKELVIFFQQFIDLRDSLINDGVDNPTIGKRVLKEFSSKKKDLSDIIKKHTNIVYKINITNDEYIVDAATTINIKSNVFKRSFVYNRYGTMGKNNIPELIKKVESLKSKFDSFEGKIPDSEKNDILNNNNILYFYPPAMFLSSLYHADAQDLTSVEIASIILHECGHVITYAELVNMIDNSLTDILKPIDINIKTVKDVKKTTKDIRQLISYTKSNTKVKDKEIIVVEKILDSIESVINRKQIKESHVGMFITICIYSCIFIIKMILDIIIVDIMIGSIDSTLSLSESKQRKKTGDLKFIKSDITKVEYNCDKYVSMHGLGTTNITALEKMRINSMLISSNTKIKKKTKTTLINYNIRKIEIFLLTCLLGKNNILYGTYQQRRESILKSITETLRSSDLPKNIESDLLLEFEELKKVIEKSKEFENSSYGWNKNVARIIYRFVSPYGILEMLTKNKEDNDYNTIIQTIEHLRNSELSYMYKKLDSMV